MGIRGRREVDPATSEQVVWWVPMGYKHDGSKAAVVECHFRGGSELEATDWTSAGGYTGSLAYAVARAGWPVVCPNLGGPATWGNDTAITRVGQARAFAQNARPVGAKAGGIFVAGVSMGFAAACNWARQNAGSCLGIIGVIYANDLQALYVRNDSGQAAEIDTAYASGWAAAQPTHNPQAYATTDLAGVPMLLIYSTDESPAADSASQATFAAALQAANPRVTVVRQTGGHSLQNFDPSPVASFLARWCP